MNYYLEKQNGDITLELLSLRSHAWSFNYRKVMVYKRSQKSTDFLPKPQVQAPQFPVHKSYFLQNCKKIKKGRAISDPAFW